MTNKMTNIEALVKVRGYLTDYLPLDSADEIDEIIEALKQEPKTIQEKQAESEKYEKAFDDGYKNGYAQARFDYEQQPCEDCFRELIREFDNKHPTIFAFYMEMFNSHPLAEIIDYMWDMHDLIEDIRYRLPMEVEI